MRRRRSGPRGVQKSRRPLPLFRSSISAIIVPARAFGVSTPSRFVNASAGYFFSFPFFQFCPADTYGLTRVSERFRPIPDAGASVRGETTQFLRRHFDFAVLQTHEDVLPLLLLLLLAIFTMCSETLVRARGSHVNIVRRIRQTPANARVQCRNDAITPYRTELFRSNQTVKSLLRTRLYVSRVFAVATRKK